VSATSASDSSRRLNRSFARSTRYFRSHRWGGTPVDWRNARANCLIHLRRLLNGRGDFCTTDFINGKTVLIRYDLVGDDLALTGKRAAALMEQKGQRL